jgi:hypothetical protein
MPLAGHCHEELHTRAVRTEMLKVTPAVHQHACPSEVTETCDVRCLQTGAFTSREDGKS